MKTRPMVEPWEREAAGLEAEDLLRPAVGVTVGFAIGFPLDVLLVLWVFA